LGLFGKKPELLPGQTPCPHCGRALEWSAPNNQWFCQKCDLFIAPDAQKQDHRDNVVGEINDIMGGKPTYYCQNCRGKLEWNEQYKRWFCAGCQVWV